MELSWQQLIMSLIVAVVSALLTVKLAFRQFLAERWWERRADGYAAILKALHVMKRTLEHWQEQLHSAKHDDDYGKARSLNYETARSQVHEAIDTGCFLLSAEAEELLKALEIDLRRAEREDDDVDSSIQESLDAVQRCLRKLPVIARRNLGNPSVS